jgi:hypothetical protein
MPGRSAIVEWLKCMRRFVLGWGDRASSRGALPESSREEPERERSGRYEPEPPERHEPCFFCVDHAM